MGARGWVCVCAQKHIEDFKYDFNKQIQRSKELSLSDSKQFWAFIKRDSTYHCLIKTVYMIKFVYS